MAENIACGATFTLIQDLASISVTAPFLSLWRNKKSQFMHNLLAFVYAFKQVQSDMALEMIGRWKR